MRYSYFVKAYGETIEDAIEFDTYYSELRFIAEAACEYAWNHDGGSHWLESNSVLTICKDGKEVGDCIVEIEVSPEFICTEKKGSK